MKSIRSLLIVLVLFLTVSPGLAAQPEKSLSKSAGWVDEVRGIGSKSVCDKVDKWLASPEDSLTATEAAKAMYNIYQMPLEVRMKAEGCWGNDEAFIDFAEGGQVMGRIIEILSTADLKPEAIGTVPSMMRQTLLADYKIRLDLFRKQPEGSGIEKVIDIIKEAVKEWNFSHKELGLTEAEISLIEYSE